MSTDIQTISTAYDPFADNVDESDDEPVVEFLTDEEDFEEDSDEDWVMAPTDIEMAAQQQNPEAETESIAPSSSSQFLVDVHGHSPSYAKDPDAMSISTTASSGTKKRLETADSEAGISEDDRNQYVPMEEHIQGQRDPDAMSITSTSTSSNAKKRSATVSSSGTAAPPAFVRTRSEPQFSMQYATPSGYHKERLQRIRNPTRGAVDVEMLGQNWSQMEQVDRHLDPATQYRLRIRKKHLAAEEWYQTYEDYDLGTVPPPDICKLAPDSQQALEFVPIRKSTRGNSSLTNFFTLKRLPGYGTAPESRKHDFQRHVCMVVIGDQVCGKDYGVRGTSGKTNHMLGKHPRLWSAIGEFRKYQEMVRGFNIIETVGESAPKGARFEALRQE
ncbi:hypothetical protein BGZ93_002828 [Podila epicladia]|nr:hypothetical protein BGZ92_003526 [Podila epicladia]KAG0080899.1 hypothetical protein BGZ93_002828 [Podila epicladia]